MKRVFFNLVGGLILLFQITAVNAATITVTANNGLVAVDGVCSISEAIINANNDAVTHSDCIAGSGADTININSDIILTTNIDSTFGNTGTPIVTSVIIIDGNDFTLQRDSVTCDYDNSNTGFEFRIIANDSNGDLRINDLTIKNGCIDTNSVTKGNGGGIYNKGTLELNNVTLENNHAKRSGGGLHNDGVINTITNSVFLSNDSNAQCCVGAGGGGLSNNGAINTIDNTEFSGNSAQGGAGIHMQRNSTITTIKNSSFLNHIGGSIGAGISLNVDSTITTIENTTFSNNSVIYSGGGISNLGTIDTIQNSLFSANTANGSALLFSGGGGINNSYQGVINKILNSTFSANSSSNLGVDTYGGGIFSPNGTLGSIENCSFYGNFASEGAAITSFESVNISNSLFLNNETWQVDTDCYFSGVTVTGNNNLSDDNTRGCPSYLSTTLTASTVGPLEDNGGPSFTHALLLNSEALNASGTSGTASDQRGFLADGTRDIGAFEAQIPVVTAPIDNTFEATGALSSPTLGVATVVDVDEIGLSAIPNPSSFALGTHTVTWTATDSQGFVDSDTQQVTIVDTTAPVITPPADIVIEATGLTTTVVLGTATALDIVDGNVTPVTADMSNPFTLAMHTITWSAADNTGNIGTASQMLNVQAVISGTVNGLNGSLTLQNNGSDNLILTTDGNFRFTTALDNLSNYVITILNQPATQNCVASNANGQINGNNISDIVVTCTDNTVSLNASSLDFGQVFVSENDTQTVTLTNTGSGDVLIDSFTNPNTPFSITGGSCMAIPMTLLSTQSCDFNIQFKSRFEGDFTDSFMVNSNTISSPNSITLTGSSTIRIIPIFSRFGLILLLLLFVIIASHHFKSTHRDIS